MIVVSNLRLMIENFRKVGLNLARVAAETN